MTDPHLSPTIIAIDGPAASGKGTLAKRLATHLNFALLDTGALYRATALEVLSSGGDPADEPTATQAATYLSRKLTVADNPQDLLGNPKLKEDETGQAASKLAAFPDVRKALLLLQRLFAHNPPANYNGAILDGRDIGTVICPEAPIKFFITAKTETRAERRTKELQSLGKSVTYEAVLKDMRERDTRDAQRSDAPMKPAEDAIIIDTEGLSQDQVFEKTLKIIKAIHPDWLDRT